MNTNILGLRINVTSAGLIKLSGFDALATYCSPRINLRRQQTNLQEETIAK